MRGWRIAALAAGALGAAAADARPLATTPPEAPTSSAATARPPTAAEAAARPAAARVVLGVSLADEPDLDVAAPGVTRVLPGSDTDRLGLRVGDRVVQVGATPVATVDAFAAAAGALRPGDALALTVLRDRRRVALAGTVSAAPRPRDVLVDGERLRAEVAAVRDDAERERIRGDVGDALALLQAAQDELPVAAAAFKRVYPQGSFRIRVDIDIRSDAAAPDAAPLPPAAAAGVDADARAQPPAGLSVPSAPARSER